MKGVRDDLQRKEKGPGSAAAEEKAKGEGGGRLTAKGVRERKEMRGAAGFYCARASESSGGLIATAKRATEHRDATASQPYPTTQSR